MGLRFRKSINLGGGLRLNVTARGVGLSAGRRGARWSINSRGRRTTSLGIPGTGISYRTSSSIRRAGPATRRRVAARPAGPPRGGDAPRPGLFASRGERRLYGLLGQAAAGRPPGDWQAELDGVLVAHPGLALAAHTVGAVCAPGGDPAVAAAHAAAVLALGDPEQDRFVRRYLLAAVAVRITVTADIEVVLPIGQFAFGAVVTQAQLARGDCRNARQSAAWLPPGPLTQVLRAQAALMCGDPQAAVAATEDVANVDDLSAFLLALRVAALAGTGRPDEALAAARDALHFPSRALTARQHARYERARLLLGQGQRGRARADLRHILAEDPRDGRAAGLLASIG